jgi:hypothetical protein
MGSKWGKIFCRRPCLYEWLEVGWSLGRLSYVGQEEQVWEKTRLEAPSPCVEASPSSCLTKALAALALPVSLSPFVLCSRPKTELSPHNSCFHVVLSWLRHHRWIPAYWRLQSWHVCKAYEKLKLKNKRIRLKDLTTRKSKVFQCLCLLKPDGEAQTSKVVIFRVILLRGH